MPFPERVTPGWSVAYPPRPISSASASSKPATRLAAGRVYSTWSLAYPPPKPPSSALPAPNSSDPVERLLSQVFDS
jgi:hypothetical protein